VSRPEPGPGGTAPLSRSRPAVRVRALAFMAATLVLVEVAFRVAAPSWVPADFRLPDRTLWGIDEFVASTKGAPGVRIAVVGDSVVWGGFADRDQTLSARMDADYASAGRRVHAFNFGMNGAHSNDLYPLVEVLAGEGAADLVVINFDYRFYRDGPIQHRYPQLLQMAASSAGTDADMLLVPFADIDEKAVPASPADSIAPSGSEQLAKELVSRVSSIAARREYILAVTIGDKPSTALARTVETAVPRLLGRPLWTKRTAAQLDLATLRSDFAVPPLTADSAYVRYLLASVRSARAHGVRVVVFAGPLDRTLLGANDLYDPALYAANLAVVGDLVRSEGGEFLDLTDTVPPEEIRDSHHPMPQGYARLARVLSGRIEPTVRALERTRASGTGAP
jgi:hypothetical protein